MADNQINLQLDAPPSDNVVRVRMLDTTGVMVLHSEPFVKPVVPGHELMNVTVVTFLIENERLGRKAMFDHGVRKDYWNLPPSIQKRLDRLGIGMRIDKDVKEILQEKGISLDSINDIIWSHSHWDHTGDTTLFPTTTNLVYGPEISSSRPGYPENPSGPVPEALFTNRRNIEIEFPPSGLEIGGYAAHDFYGDGSFYLLSTPGHAKGHMCGLARTTPDTFILMGGDVCHFAGDLRPNKVYPFPDPVPRTTTSLSSDLKDDPHRSPKQPLPASVFLANHPQFQNLSRNISSSRSLSTNNDDDDSTTTTTTTNPSSLSHPQDPNLDASTTPYYLLSTSTNTVYATPSAAVAQSTVQTLIESFDTNPKVLVALAHDTALLNGVLPTFNSSPDRDLNSWFANGWKDQVYWGWIGEVLVREGGNEGNRDTKDIVDGWWKDGKRFETAKEVIDDAEQEREKKNQETGASRL